jgi:hypothetical protein
VSRLAPIALLLIAQVLSGSASAAPDQLDTAVIDPAALSAQPAGLAFTRIRDAGATTVRIVVYWRWVAPDRRPPDFDPSNPADQAYRWALVDDQVRRAAAAGLRPVIGISRAPAWARDPAGGPGTTWPDPVELGQFARAAATRYRGDFVVDGAPLPAVRYWQVWNEPNAGRELSPQFRDSDTVSPGEYRRMLAAFTPAVHMVDPSDIVIAGGTAPFGHRSRDIQVTAPMRFMRALLCMSAKPPYRPTCSAQVHFDAWAHNPYTNGGPTHRAYSADDVSLGDLPRMNALLRAAVRAGHVVSTHPVQFFVTEFSWDSNRPDPHGVPLRLEARWVAEALYQMWRSGVSLVTWFRLRDDPLTTSPYQSGLYFYGGKSLTLDKPKPALQAFRFPFVAFRRARGLVFWGRTPGGLPHTVVVEGRTKRSGWRRLIALSTNAHGLFTGRLRPFDGKSLRARVIMDGGAVSLPFSLERTPDRQVFPFGCGGPIGC